MPRSPFQIRLDKIGEAARAVAVKTSGMRSRWKTGWFGSSPDELAQEVNHLAEAVYRLVEEIQQMKEPL